MGATIDEIIDSEKGTGKKSLRSGKNGIRRRNKSANDSGGRFLSGMEQVAEKFRKEEVGVPEILSVTRALDRGVSTLRHYSVGRAKKKLEPL